MKTESEIQYCARTETIDNASRWGNEAGYYQGMGDDGGTSWVDAFKEVLPVVASAYQQDRFTKANINLINQGKPPMSAEQYNAMQPASAKVQIGPTDDAKKWIVYAGIGLLALVGLRAAKVI
jgi:hypothetical protein